MGDPDTSIARQPWVGGGWAAPVLVRVAASRGAPVIPAVIHRCSHSPSLSRRREHGQQQQEPPHAHFPSR